MPARLRAVNLGFCGLVRAGAGLGHARAIMFRALRESPTQAPCHPNPQPPECLMPIEWLLFPALGLCAGLLAGLLGVGGGLVLVAGLVFLLPAQGVPADSVMHAALGTSLASVIITSIASTRAHARRGSVLWPSAAWLVPGLLVGGWLGSLLATRMAGESLRLFVVAYCALSALQLLWGKTAAKVGADAVPRGGLLSAAGVFIGAISALVGIGGGSMTVPLLIWRGVAPVRAVGTSAACGIAIGVSAAAGFALHAKVSGMPAASLGFIFLPAAIGISLTYAWMAPHGAALAHRISPLALRRVFAAFLLLMAALLLRQ